MSNFTFGRAMFGELDAQCHRYVGFQSKELIVKGNLRLGDVDQYPNIDVTIDGADEFVIPSRIHAGGLF